MGIQRLFFLIFLTGTSILTQAQESREGRLKFPSWTQFSIGLSATYGDLAESRDEDGFSAYYSYEKHIANSPLKSTYQSSGIQNLEGLENRYLNSTEYLEEWNNAGIQERSEMLSRFVEDQTGEVLDRSIIQAEYAVQYAISNPQDWSKEFNRLGPSLSLEEKFLIASQLGGQFGEKYNVDRAEDGVGVVTIEELFTSLQSGAPGGVCRDISKAQGQILNALGVPEENIFIVAYTTPGGSHATLAVADPDNPQKILKANYDYYTQAAVGVQEAALLQEGGRLIETGITYRVYGLDGRPVGSIPTEVNSVLRDVFNSTMKKASRTNFNLYQVQAEGPLGTTLAFGADTSAGDRIQGIGHQYIYDVSPSNQLKFSLAIYQRDASRNGGDLHQDAIYFSMENRNEVFKYKTDVTQVTAGMMSIVELQYARNKFTYNSGTEHDSETIEAHGFFIGFIEAEHKLSYDRKISGDAGVVTYLDFQDVSAGPDGGFQPVFDHFYVNGQFEFGLGEGKADTEVGIVIRQFGETGHAEFGYSFDDSTRVFAGGRSRLSEETPGFVPDSSREIYAGIDRRCKNRVTRAYYSKNFDSDTSQANLEFRILLDKRRHKRSCR